MVAAMERTIDDQSFMLGALQGPSEKLPPGVRAQRGERLDFFEKAVVPLTRPDAKPSYEA